MNNNKPITVFRRKIISRPMALSLLLAMILQLLIPVAASAIGGGPSQPEATGFKQAGAGDMVDPFTGDFSYNIPLLDVDGYPVNLAYSSGISMEQEATWVGLGWTLNAGALNRSMRGVPDDFAGDQIVKENNIKNNHTYGLDVNSSVELIGADLKNLAEVGQGKFPGISGAAGINWNNYQGISMHASGTPASIKLAAVGNLGLTGYLGINASSSSGASLIPSFAATLSTNAYLQNHDLHKPEYTFCIGFPYNSNTGFSRMDFGLTIEKAVANQAPRYKESSTLSFGHPFSIPLTRMSTLNTNLSISATLGLAGYGLHANIEIEGYYAGQFLLSKRKEIGAYGYLNTQMAQKDHNHSMLDFNREKEGSYTENTPRLPVTNYTYDLLTASGQGMSGTYRPHRNDVGVMRDDIVRSYSAGLNTPGMEFGASAAFHLGANFSVNATNSYSGIWEDDNEILDKLYAHNTSTETFYYKKVGDKAPDLDVDFMEKVGGLHPVRVNLTDGTQHARSELEKDNGIPFNVDEPLGRNRHARAKRNEPLFGIPASQASAALNEYIRSYDFVDVASMIDKRIFTKESDPQPYTDISRTSRPRHHMTEYTAVNTSGVRYVYGIPAYNTLQQDVAFAVPFNGNECSYDNLVGYGAADDHPDQNDNGRDNYYQRITTPAYAHSYLLTAVLSDDYADLTRNGPTDDDKGTYTKFNYSKLGSSYKWRTPFTATEYQAYYNAGIGADKLDDKASYVYGEKELWYLHSIETKNYVAVFVTGDRADACSAEGPQGGRSETVKGKLLSRIELYVKSELMNKNHPVPLKTVHFEYDYSLCPNVPSNGNSPGTNGKLTLKKVYFSYGKSHRAMHRGYTFDYEGNGAHDNPSYSEKSSDRWGSYKPAGTVSNADYPYAEQDKALADSYAAAWNLKKITLPSGGTISVEYEADDYGFVQDRRAMQMFTLLGSSMGKTEGMVPQIAAAGGTCSRKEGLLYEKAITGIECSPYQYFFVKVNEPVLNKEELKAKYFTDEHGRHMNNLYYKFYVKTLDETGAEGDAANNFEAVPGYITSEGFDYGVCNYAKDETDRTRYIWIRLKPVNIGDYFSTGNANPVSKAAWKFLRLSYPRLGQARADFDPDKTNPLAVFEEMASAALQVYQTFAGYFFNLRQRNLCRKFDCEKSVFRLYSPGFKKTGGGSRVKKVMLSDQFYELTGQHSAYGNQTYGKEYSYTTMHNGRTISSGVASYEPMLGGEESPFKEPLYMGTDQDFMAIGTDYLQEGKFGESFFPAPSVGYSKVTVRSLRKTNSRSTATGREEHEFYTSRDFPNRVHETGVEAYRDNPRLVFTFVKFFSYDHLATSQGYAVELNDMHGKQKAMKSFSEYNDSVPVNATYYFYKRDPADAGKLDNRVTTVDSKGNVNRNVTAGMETDIVVDFREETSYTHGGALAGNLDAFIAFIPMALPTFFPYYSNQNVLYRSAVVTKVIHRSGLLDSMVVTDNGARKITHNVALDHESGEVLVTRINNNFDEDVYQVNIPAYWMYDEMSHAYKRTGAVYNIKNVLARPADHLKEGDEVLFGNYYGWVMSTSPSLGILSSSGVYYNLQEIIDEEGVEELRVIRSGNHNKIMLPASATIVRNNPVAGNQLSFGQVIDANAKYYDDNWRVFCGCNNFPGRGYNPYIAGRRGNFQLVADYVFLTGRTQTNYNNNLNVRRDGVYTSFSPFWTYNQRWQADRERWTFTSINSEISSTGAILETRDPLQRFSSAQFSFADRASVAIAQNARYREIGFESFEDYDFLSTETCKQSHFSFFIPFTTGTDGDMVGTRSQISLDGGHSGRYSLKINGLNNYIKIRKTLLPCN